MKGAALIPDGHTPRSRMALVACTALVIVLGLASRAWPGLLPAALGKYPGDALWASMVWLGWAMAWPRASAAHLAWLALITASAVEWSQLYKAPWIDTLRDTTIGHLVLGRAFAMHDIVAYAVGIAVIVVLDHACDKIRFVFSLHHPGGSHV